MIKSSKKVRLYLWCHTSNTRPGDSSRDKSNLYKLVIKKFNLAELYDKNKQTLDTKVMPNERAFLKKKIGGKKYLQEKFTHDVAPKQKIRNLNSILVL